MGANWVALFLFFSSSQLIAFFGRAKNLNVRPSDACHLRKKKFFKALAFCVDLAISRTFLFSSDVLF